MRLEFTTEELATLDKALDIAARYMIDGLRTESSNEGRQMLTAEVGKMNELRTKVRRKL